MNDANTTHDDQTSNHGLTPLVIEPTHIEPVEGNPALPEKRNGADRSDASRRAWVTRRRNAAARDAAVNV